MEPDPHAETKPIPTDRYRPGDVVPVKRSPSDQYAPALVHRSTQRVIDDHKGIWSQVMAQLRAVRSVIWAVLVLVLILFGLVLFGFIRLGVFA